MMIQPANPMMPSLDADLDDVAVDDLGAAQIRKLESFDRPQAPCRHDLAGFGVDVVPQRHCVDRSAAGRRSDKAREPA